MGEWMSTRCTYRGALPRTFLRSKYATQDAYDYYISLDYRQSAAGCEGGNVRVSKALPTNQCWLRKAHPAVYCGER